MVARKKLFGVHRLLGDRPLLEINAQMLAGNLNGQNEVDGQAPEAAQAVVIVLIIIKNIQIATGVLIIVPGKSMRDHLVGAPYKFVHGGAYNEK